MLKVLKENKHDLALIVTWKLTPTILFCMPQGS